MCNLSSFRKKTSITNYDDSRNKCEKFNICVYRNFSIYRSFLHEPSHIPENTSKSSGTDNIGAKLCEIPNSASIYSPRFWAGDRTRSGRVSLTWQWPSSPSSSCTSSVTSSGSSLASLLLHSWVRISYLFVEFCFCHDLNAEKYKTENARLHNIHGIFTLSRYQ